ncbi:hypothetical protein B0T18DRAFT_441495 [Schizothecium vesticola]|uniref:Uncharacterized protein n=1 Tax=Schizothecium vesticola TaxID=314040 RepID=A0AA40BKI8_9PEZI|nr:hypothetical protein B0T18DRAFT_441495 [Schizothecium vesticola]
MASPPSRAKAFASAVQAGNLSKPAEDDMRRSIGGAAQKMAAETLSPIDLAKSEYVVAVEAQESLVARLCGFLLSTGKLLPGALPNHVRHSRFSRICVSTSPFYSMNAIHAGNGVRSFALWPQYFATYGRAEPPRVTHTPFSFAWGHPELAPWEVKALYPEYAALFAQGMESKVMALSGASVYLVRRILLDYPDSMATGILRQLADAMSADKPKARVLIVEERLSEPPEATTGLSTP